MLELLQWLAILLLGVLVGLFFKNRQEDRLPRWLRDICEDDIVTQSDLDRYHHRVVQLAQTQRELIDARTDEILHRVEILEKAGKAPVETAPMDARLEEPPRDTAPSGLPNGEGFPPPEVCLGVEKDPSPALETVAPDPWEPESPEASPEAFDRDKPEGDRFNRVMRAWDEGLSVDRIARDLRMGRQEVQLLIQMGRSKTATRHGT